MLKFLLFSILIIISLLAVLGLITFIKEIRNAPLVDSKQKFLRNDYSSEEEYLNKET